MTGNQWLLFVGLPAFFAIILLIADYVRSRRRIEITISTRLPDESPERAAAEEIPDVKPVSSRPAAGHPDPLANSAELPDESPERAIAEEHPDVKPVSSQPEAGHSDPLAELERLISGKRPR